MAYLEHHPIHIRKKIALTITICIAVVLFTVLAIIYLSPKRDKSQSASDSAFMRFYATTLESAQSYFGGSRDIIPK